VDAHVSTLANVLQRANFESFTYLSSTRIYANSEKAEESQPIQVYSHNPSDLYNLSKLLGESICFATNRPEVKVARLSNVIGHGLSDTNFVGELIRDAKLGHVKLKSHVDSAKDYIVIDDVTCLLHNIATRGSERLYNVASGIQITNGELLFELQHFYGCEIETDEMAPLIRFPPICIQKILTEFHFNPSDVKNLFPSKMSI
jgi:nucleoside-diphosphate-sugar epimerase